MDTTGVESATVTSDSDAATAACQKCATDISTDADRCPACGYEPGTDGQLARTVGFIIAGLLCITVIGAVIGVPLAIGLWKLETTVKERTPTSYAPA